jgi:hypothetical protein
MSRLAARTAVLAVVLVALLFVVHLARAGELARAQHSLTTSSGEWGATGALNPNGPVPGTQLTTSWTTLNFNTPKFGTVTNTGSLALATASYTVTDGGLSLSDVKVEACFGATWNTAADTCAGTIVLLDSSSSAGATTAIAPSQPNTSLSVRLTPTGLAVVLTATLSISVTRADVRAATVKFS